MFFENPYLKARNALVNAWLVILGSIFLGSVIPLLIIIVVAKTTFDSYIQILDFGVLIAVSMVLSNHLTSLLFLIRRRVGIFGAIIYWIFSAIICLVLSVKIQDTFQDFLLQNPDTFRVLFAVLWLVLSIIVPVIFLFRMRKLNEQYKLSLSHKESILIERANRKKRKRRNTRMTHYNKGTSSFDDDYYDKYADARESCEKYRREEDEWEEEEDRLYQEENDYYDYYQPTYSDDD